MIVLWEDKHAIALGKNTQIKCICTVYIEEMCENINSDTKD